MTVVGCRPAVERSTENSLASTVHTVGIVEAILVKPLVVLHRDMRTIAILPSSAKIDLQYYAPNLGLVDVEWNGQFFSVFRDDLLDACTVDDAVRLLSI